MKLILPKVKEADVIGMVPTSSTTISLLLGDCLATTAIHKKRFSKDKFKVFHPGGSIGNSLLLAKDIMVSGNKMPVISYKKNSLEIKGFERINFSESYFENIHSYNSLCLSLEFYEQFKSFK